VPDLTDTQLRVVRYLKDFHDREGYYATVRDVQEHFGWKSSSTPHEVLTRLVEKGFVVRAQVTHGKFVFQPSGLW
jgi:SOS-response transcriptional repressor LexA